MVLLIIDALVAATIVICHKQFAALRMDADHAKLQQGIKVGLMYLLLLIEMIGTAAVVMTSVVGSPRVIGPLTLPTLTAVGPWVGQTTIMGTAIGGCAAACGLPERAWLGKRFSRPAAGGRP